jgi:hypothetical protein
VQASHKTQIKMKTEFKASHLDLIVRTKANLLDLLNEGVLSLETVNEYIKLLDDKFDEIYSQLNK